MQYMILIHWYKYQIFWQKLFDAPGYKSNIRVLMWRVWYAHHLTPRICRHKREVFKWKDWIFFSFKLSLEGGGIQLLLLLFLSKRPSSTWVVVILDVRTLTLSVGAIWEMSEGLYQIDVISWHIDYFSYGQAQFQVAVCASWPETSLRLDT